MVKDNQTYLDQNCLNVFFYECVAGGTADSEALASLIRDNIVNNLVDIQNEGVVHRNIYVENLDDYTDFFTLTLTTGNVGTISGQGLPPYAAWSFILERASRLVRNGHKRIVGVSEASQSNGLPISGILSLLADTGTALAASFADSDDNIYVPRIAHRTVVPHVSTTYLLYPIASASFTAIGTQNSRKFGRGM